MDKWVVLLAYSNQSNDFLPHLQEEVNGIHFCLTKAWKEQAEIQQIAANSIEDIARLIRELKDRIVLFSYSGHASKEAWLLQNQKVFLEGFAPLLKECDNLKLVMLNGCSTAGQARALEEIGVPFVIGTSRPTLDELAKKFAIAFFEALSNGKYSLEGAYLHAKNNLLSIDPKLPFPREEGIKDRRAGRKLPDEISDQQELWGIYGTFSNANILFWDLCSLPLNLTFAEKTAGAKVLFVHDKNSLGIYEELENWIERVYAECIPKSVQDACNNGDWNHFNIEGFNELWMQADCVCILVKDSKFNQFWKEIAPYCQKLKIDFPKPVYFVNININKDLFSSFCSEIEGCEIFPKKDIWFILPTLMDYEEKANSGYSDLIAELKQKLSTPIKEAHLKEKLNEFNYRAERSDFEIKEKFLPFQLITIEGTFHCGQEWLMKRLLARTLKKKPWDIKPHIIDFAGEEIGSTNDLWNCIGERVVGQRDREPIIEGIKEKLNFDNILITLLIPETNHTMVKGVIESFWQEWLDATAPLGKTSFRFYLVVINKAFDPDHDTGSLQLAEIQQTHGRSFKINPIQPLDGLYGRESLESWHKTHNKSTFSELQYKKLLDNKEKILSGRFIKKVVWEICTLYNCPSVHEELFRI